MENPEKPDDDMSMDEILASIRRIISEDTKHENRTIALQEEGPVQHAFASPDIANVQHLRAEAVAAPVVEPKAAEPVAPFMSSTGTTLYGFSKEGKGDFFSAPPEFGQMRPPASQTPAPEQPPIYSPQQMNTPQPVEPLPREARAEALPRMPEIAMPSLNLGEQNSQLQTFVYDLIRPLLKDWVNAYLPTLIEKAVAVEVSKMFQKLREP